MAEAAPAPQGAKVVYFVRHGLAEHNAALELREMSDEEVLREYAERYHDSRLSDRGREEAAALRSAVEGLSPLPQVVITSSLSRTTATAVAAFGGLGVPILASELWRERSGRWPCERRRTRRALAADFPGVDYSEVPTEEDALWGEEREGAAAASRRAAAAVRQLLARPERVLAVVSHAGFMGMSVFNAKRNEALSRMTPKMQVPFKNCEMRRVELLPDAAAVSAELTLKSVLASSAPRDPAEKRRAEELQHGNMGRLNALFSTARGEELLRAHRADFPRIFAADDGLARASRL